MWHIVSPLDFLFLWDFGLGLILRSNDARSLGTFDR